MKFQRCNYCLDIDSIINFYEYHDLGLVPMSLELTESFTAECPNCDEFLEEGDIIISNEYNFLEEVAKEIGEVLSAKIAECQDCNNDKILYEQRHGDLDNLNTVFELLEEWQFDKEVRTHIRQFIRCSNCNDVLSEDTPYVTSEELASWYGEYDEVFDQVFEVSSQEGNEFIDYLEQHPMLGLNHPIGKKIFKMIQDETVKGNYLLKPGTQFLRGRTRRKMERLVPFVKEELWNPPVEVSSQGRYNPAGVSVLYLAETEEVIIKELAYNKVKTHLDIAEFQVKQQLKVLDLSKTNSSNFSRMHASEDSAVKKEYLFPNFVMQCLMINDFKGIIYDSVKEDGINICLFNFGKEKDITINKVYTYN